MSGLMGATPAPEATPVQQYRWLGLLERHWIGTARGNQVI
jgi:ribonucleoside-triphosphate reductase (formate)